MILLLDMENNHRILGKRNTWLQILFWGGLWLLIPYLITSNNNFDILSTRRGEFLLYRNIIIFIGISILIFINIEILIPKFYAQKQIFSYILGCIVLLSCIILLMNWDAAPWAEWVNPSFQRPRMGFRPKMRMEIMRGRDFNSMRYVSQAMPFLTSLLGSSLFEISSLVSQKDKETVRLQKEKLEAEMKFLKSQINPHFLFNSLNNIYTLILVQSESAGPNLLKLSDMLRYMLYDCKADKVPLIKEIEYIKNYIDLIKLKDSSGLNVQVELSEEHPQLMVAPLLFIPFIENAFKHSKIEDLERGWIKIKLDTQIDKIRLLVQNSIPEANFNKDNVGGIGLQNVKKQLELMYPEEHILHIQQQGNEYIVSLTIHMS